MLLHRTAHTDVDQHRIPLLVFDLAFTLRNFKSPLPAREVGCGISACSNQVCAHQQALQLAQCCVALLLCRCRFELQRHNRKADIYRHMTGVVAVSSSFTHLTVHPDDFTVAVAAMRLSTRSTGFACLDLGGLLVNGGQRRGRLGRCQHLQNKAAVWRRKRRHVHRAANGGAGCCNTNEAIASSTPITWGSAAAYSWVAALLVSACLAVAT